METFLIVLFCIILLFKMLYDECKLEKEIEKDKNLFL